MVLIANNLSALGKKVTRRQVCVGVCPSPTFQPTSMARDRTNTPLEYLLEAERRLHKLAPILQQTVYPDA